MGLLYTVFSAVRETYKIDGEPRGRMEYAAREAGAAATGALETWKTEPEKREWLVAIPPFPQGQAHKQVFALLGEVKRPFADREGRICVPEIYDGRSLIEFAGAIAIDLFNSSRYPSIGARVSPEYNFSPPYNLKDLDCNPLSSNFTLEFPSEFPRNKRWELVREVHKNYLVLINGIANPKTIQDLLSGEENPVGAGFGDTK